MRVVLREGEGKGRKGKSRNGDNYVKWEKFVFKKFLIERKKEKIKKRSAFFVKSFHRGTLFLR